MFRNFRTIISIGSLIVVLALLGGMFTPITSVQAREGGSLPVGPTGMITNHYPTYKWYNIVLAVNYKYEVYKNNIFFYRVNTAGDCATTYCTDTATVNHPIASYKWRIQYYDGASWTAWSDWKTFRVVPEPTDFDAYFNGSMAGWSEKPGGDWKVSSTALYTLGLDDAWSSIYRSTSPVYRNFDFMALVKRTTDNVNCLAVRMGSSFATSINMNLGYPGYLFCYRNSGYFSVWEMDSVGANPIQDWTATSFVNDGDWNKLRVVAVSSFMDYYINGNLVFRVNDSSRKYGYVGFTIGTSPAGSTFYVDSANLRILFATAPNPFAQIDPVQQALNEAAQADGRNSSLEGPLP